MTATPGVFVVASTFFLIYAGGLTFSVLSAVLFAPGKPVFDKSSDSGTVGVIVAAGIYGVQGLATGTISI